MKRTLKGIVATLVASFVMSVIPLSTLAATEVEINADNFGSDSFASYLKTVEKTTAGCNGDGKFSDSELKLIKSLKPDSSVTRIIGLKVFSNLKELDVSACYKLTRLNASKATSLNTLKLGSIENLEFLYVMNTAVSSIDVSNLAGLKKLYLSESPVTSINLANNTELLELGLDGTAITSLDISACTNLRSLDISNNGDAIESLNIGHNIWLVRTGVVGDKKSEDNVIEYKKTQDDIEYLLRLDSGTNVYCAIDETIFPDLIFRKEIESKDPNKDGILSLDELIDFQYLNINGDYKLKSIEGIEIFYNLKSLWLNCCKLPYVDLSDNPNISKLELNNGSTREINLDNLKCLNSLTVFACELTNLVFPDNSEISVLNVSSNFNLKNLDLSNLSKLTSLKCDQCGISELDISNQKLTTLSCVRNGITALDLSGQNQLSFLFCEGNEITSFDLSDTKLNEMMNSVIYKDGRFVDNYNGSRFSCDNTVEIKGLTCPLITPTVAPTVTPTVTPEVTPTSTPSKTPTVTPTATPTSKPTGAPTSDPTSAPSVAPTKVPVAIATPTAKPTVVPTKTPTAVPTTKPTVAPTKAPVITLTATPKPTAVATSIPKPTNVATTTPTSVPTAEPIKAPTVEDFAERLYTTCLGRVAEQAGKDYWVSELKAGKPGSEVAQGFFFSPEFIGFNLDNEEYITRLYRTFMGREPDADGMSYWLGEMANGQGRVYVFDGFVNSPEWADICLTYGIRSGGLASPTFEKMASKEVLAFAERLYTTCLGRDSEPEGLKYWSQELANLRQSGSEVAKGFFFSPEFVDSKFDDSEYLTRLYKTVMGREPEKDGFNYWMGELKSGNMTRESVFDGFAASPEWIGICADYGILR